MPNQPEHHSIAEYMKAFDRPFLLLPEKMAAEHRREIEQHLRQLVQQAILEGMSEEEAERQAIATFGPPREVARPLIVRWLKTVDRNRRPRNIVSLASQWFKTPCQSAYRFSKPWQVVAYFIVIDILGCYPVFLPPSPPRSLQIEAALISGMLLGVMVTIVTSEHGNNNDIRTEKLDEALRKFADDAAFKRSYLKESFVRYMGRRLCFLISRGLLTAFDERKRYSFASIFNFKFFLAYGTAFLVVNLLPAHGARVFDYFLSALMTMRIGLATKHHILRRA